MLEWIFKHEVIQYIFGPGVHLEVLRRAGDLIKFVAKHRRLTTEVTDLIWKLYQDVGARLSLFYFSPNQRIFFSFFFSTFLSFLQQNQHLSVVHGVLVVLGEVISSLSLELQTHIFQKILAIPLEKLDPQALAFINRITHSAVNSPQHRDSEQPVPRYGADIFWAVTRDESPVSKEVAFQGFTYLCQFCSWSPHPEHKFVFSLDLSSVHLFGF